MDGKNIYFMGFMATGKSRIGFELASLLNWKFYDSDAIIEKKAGKSIRRIFQQDGELFFRKLESDVVYELSQRTNCVIALGGGAVVNPENWRKISNSGITICLTASKELIFKRIYSRSDRPLMIHESSDELMEKIEKKLEERSKYYLRAAFIFENSESTKPRELARNIYEKLVKYP
ncbi:shikimate kinase [candidate division KSB1 bacterium]|nr:shikimate kinase [candidate division KSB1 bacterium]